MMKIILVSLFLLFSITYSQIPDFNKELKLEGIDPEGAICFVKWDDDDLVDILWVDNIIYERSKLVFFKNIGTASSPSYKRMGFVKDKSGREIRYEHSWCGGIIDPRVGDLNNDGLDDLVFGVYKDLNPDGSYKKKYLKIFLKNSNGTVTLHQELAGTTYYVTPELVDYNGDGLLDIITALHQHGPGSPQSRKIFFNRGTKESPKFDSNDYEYFNFSDSKLNSKGMYWNLLFTDLNQDNKKDLIFYTAFVKDTATFHYSLNISSNDSIVLGPVQKLQFKGTPVELPEPPFVVVQLGNKLAIAMHDNNNDGIKEFYFNTLEGWKGYYFDPETAIYNKVIENNTLKGNVKTSENRIWVDSYNANTELLLYNPSGKLIKSKILSSAGQDEIMTNDLSPGAYIVQLKTGNYNRTINIKVVK